MPSASLNPIDNPQDWDVIRIGGVTSPGVCSVSDFKSKHEWDVKKGKGTYGATLTYVGRPPCQGTIKFKLWTPAHFIAWASFRDLFNYIPDRKAVTPIDIYHPALADVGLNSVVCEGVGQVVHEGEQLYSITVELIEYFPSPKANITATPAGSKSKAPNPNSPVGASDDPVADAQQKVVAALLNKAGQP